MTRFFTADLHLGHANIIRYCDRPFSSVGEMGRVLLATWRAIVGAHDEVWVLGDLALNDVVASLELVKELPGRKLLVPGNHDRCWSGHKKAVDRWKGTYRSADLEVVDAPVTLRLANGTVLLDHFPYDSSPDQRHAAHWPVDNGGWLLHGHVHTRWRQNGRQVNVGVDAWGGRPVAESELSALIARGPALLPPLPFRAPAEANGAQPANRS